MENSNLTKGHLFADEVNVDLDVLRSLVVDGVGRHETALTLPQKTIVAEGSWMWSSWSNCRSQQHLATT
jgi:hypothetical protein